MARRAALDLHPHPLGLVSALGDDGFLRVTMALAEAGALESGRPGAPPRSA